MANKVVISLHRPKVIRFEGSTWAFQSATLILSEIQFCIKKKGICSVMLTGGKSAQKLYIAMSKIKSFQELKNVNFYFGDERCVAPDDPDSNYGMAKKTLFPSGNSNLNIEIYRMEGYAKNLEDAASQYEAKLPNQIDILLLGVGDDGHVASIFPQSNILLERRRKVVFVSGDARYVHDRLTITRVVIENAKSVYLLAPGKSKLTLLSKALEQPDLVSEFPVRLALNGTWLSDMSG